MPSFSLAFLLGTTLLGFLMPSLSLGYLMSGRGGGGLMGGGWVKLGFLNGVCKLLVDSTISSNNVLQKMLVSRV